MPNQVMDKEEQGPGTAYEQCFSGSSFTAQYEDECPVNYSLKYSETESCKTASKCDDSKNKFKGFSDYAETDLDQPTDFSLKYAEKSYDDDNKSNAFSYFGTHKVKFKEYTDYVETDLDQPTDFTLKYRESAEEEIKNGDFNYYENERKPSSNYGSRRTRAEESEDTPCERLPERYTSQNETPLMFSRSSSMNSLSSFVHITQSIPDDRSSVVSDFSRMTSGIISPSELPDSPTQTAPSSPKRHKHSASFPAKPDYFAKQSVFEDDVATYKQEDTPIEFSRATSLSSLNLDGSIRSELVFKRNTTSLQVPKEENQHSLEQIQPEYLKQQMAPEKTEHDKGKFELASVLEVDESLCSDCISIDIQINCRKPKPGYGRLVDAQESNAQLPQSGGFSVKPNLRLRFPNESRKGYSTYEGSDDAVHTYHTEGTPANVSHAGSHSDLSALSIVSGNPFSGGDGASDSESPYPEISETVPVDKAESHKSNLKVYGTNTSMKMSMSKGLSRDIYMNDQPRLDYFAKQKQLTAGDETATFATENSPCNFSIRSSLNDLTVNVLDQPLSISRGGACEGPPSQIFSPLHNVSPQSPNSLVFEDTEDTEKSLEEQQNEFDSSVTINRTTDGWDHSVSEKGKTEKSLEKDDLGRRKTVGDVSVSFEFDSNQPLTPFEEALLEECIRLGMPPKKNQKRLQETHFRLNEQGKPSEQRNREEVDFLKSTLNRSKYLSEKKSVGSSVGSSGCDTQASRSMKCTPGALNPDNFDFDTSEPLTPFEEVLLEQCILLGMPQRKNLCQENLEESSGKYLSEGNDNVVCNSAELITPLETALLEQCIRLGMPQKKNQKKGDGNALLDESPKAVTCLTAHLNKLKLNSETEKDRDAAKKLESCSCGKKHNSRRKSSNCKKSKNRLDHFKVEICPG